MAWQTVQKIGANVKVQFRTLQSSASEINKKINDKGAAVLLIVTGLIGFYFGMFHYGTYQTAVESAQVLAGIVQYPPSNPFYIYHVKLWTIISQMLAVFLYFGVTEYTLNLAVSGIMGLLVFQSLALLVWVLSRNFFLAMCSSILIFMYIIFDWKTSGLRYYDSVVYPLFLVGNKASFGGIGLPYVLLIFALMGGRYFRLGSLCTGLAPAVHPSLGAFCISVLLIALISERRLLKPEWRKIAVFGSIGLLISVISFLVHLHFAGNAAVSPLSRDMQNMYLQALLKNDPHRQPVNLLTWGMLSHLTVIFFSGFWLRVFKSDLTLSLRLLLKTFIGAAALSLLLCLLSGIQDRLPLELVIMMPGRFQNIVLLSFPALLLGLFGSRRESFFSLMLAVFLAAMLAVSFFHIGVEADIIPALTAVGAVVLYSALTLLKKRPSGLRFEKLTAGLVSGLLLSSVLYVAYYVIEEHDVEWQDTKLVLNDWSNNAGLNRLKTGKGLMLVSSDLELMQLRTRRPIVIEPPDLTVPYSLDVVPLMDEILRNIYGFELLGPRTEKKNDTPTALDFWKRRSGREWEELAAKFGFTQVVTPVNSHLNLPIQDIIETYWGTLMVYNVYP